MIHLSKTAPVLQRSRFAPDTIFPLAITLLLLLIASASQAQVYISEFLADNQLNSVVDEDGDHSDWIELWNSGASPVVLNGWYLTDTSGDLRRWQFPITTPVVSLAANARMIIFASAKDRRLNAAKLHTNFKLSKSAGSYLGLVRPDGLTIEYSYDGYPQQVQDITYGVPLQTQLQTLVAPGDSGKAKVPTSSADMAAGWNSSPTFDDSTWQAGATGFGYDTTGSYGTLVGAGGDLQTAMYLQNSTALIRIPFNASNLASIISLKLSIKYDDAYVCYLNGNEIARSSFAPGVLQWNSSATFDRNGASTTTYEVPGLSSTAQNFLVNGTNILAFQLLNNTNGSTEDTDNQGTPNGSRALCLPLLEANINAGFGAPNYLQSATPGSTNSAARGSLGPSISQTVDKPARPVGDATSTPIVITTKVVPTLKPLAASSPVQLKYRINYGGESTVVMQDNGVAPDLIAGDSVYTGQIPTTNVGVGQLIRWRIVATDNAATAATDPPYLNTIDNDQYFGTVTLDGITTSQLPILHWFVNPSDISPTYNPGTSSGARCAFFYVERLPDGSYAPGRFYDNVKVDLHGQSTSGFPVNKKSHDINFSHDNKFVWKTGEGDVASINLLTNYADKAKVRNTLAYETWAAAGHIASHFSIPVRVQQNAAFWGVYDIVENGNGGFLNREGLDENGELYKIYDTLTTYTTAEKKTGQPLTGNPSSDNISLSNFENALNTSNTLASRRLYGYDNVDIPSMINFLAVNDLMVNNDQGHKNFYMYHDSFGTNEWSILPWDQDLSYGHTWTSSQAYFDDDIDAQRPLRNGADNRLKQLIWQSPEMNQMYVRRLRSLMDKFLVSAAATNGPLETRINQLLDTFDPPSVTATIPGIPSMLDTDANRDMVKWGFWVDGSSASIAYTDSRMNDHRMRPQAARVLNSNPNPPYPSSNPYAAYGYTSVPPFLTGRRSYLFTQNPTSGGVAIPASQPAVPTGLTIEQIDFNPSSGTQDHEFFVIKNASGSAIDVSGWKVTGGIDYQFRGGTVIPNFTGSDNIGLLHVARKPRAFRQRTTGPTGNQDRLVVGPYSGQLSARGETVSLIIPGATPAQDVVVASTTYVGAPTAAQNSLRVTELAFNPAPPTASELAALPGVQASDFEFIELMNTGGSPLNIGGAYFDKGLTFTFPANYTLQAGERCVVASLVAAYNVRYAGSGANVAGQFEGNLDNSGETIQLYDSVGELILKFTYDPLWFGIPDPLNPSNLIFPRGYSLVMRSGTPLWNGYETPTNWALGGVSGGTPGSGDTSFSNVYIGWRKNYFSAAEEGVPSLVHPTADPDVDGRSNFEEWAFGGNPRVADNKPQPIGSRVTVGGTDYLGITFDRQHNALDTTYTVEASSDLTNWQAVDLPVGSATALANGMERVTYRDLQPINGNQRFLRVRATR